MSNKLRYSQHCAEEKRIPVFSRDWWLDAACGNNWDVCIVEKNNQVVASMPYMIEKKYGFISLKQPRLTPRLGPWFKPSESKYSVMLGQQKDLMEQLIEQLPPYHYVSQQWSHSYTNWLPFYWAGFKQTTQYSYIIEDLEDMDQIWASLGGNIRRECRKASTRFKLNVRVDLPLEEFIVLHEKTFQRQGMKPSYSMEYVNKLVEAACKHGQCKWFIAQDNNGLNYSGALIVWDENAAYYLMGGGDPELRNSGASSLCLWEAINYASTVTKSFDFEGSMSEQIERFFRGFGAVQTPYFKLEREKSNVLKALKLVKRWL